MHRVILCLLVLAALGYESSFGQTQPVPSTCLTNSAITLAPYVQAQSGETVVVQWQTAQPAYGWVEYGATPALGQQQAAAAYGLRVANVKEHRVTLAGLQPGTTYWYRVGFKPIRSFGAYRVDYEPEQYSETVTFHTLPGPKQALTAVIFNDLHNQIPTFQQLCSVLGDKPFDFSLFNGDCLADPEREPQVLASLTAFTHGVRADSHPTFFLRGNHETRGAFARELPRLLAWPGGQPYFAFSAGAVRFLALDCGEDKPDGNREYSGLAAFEPYRREETAWLKQELASPEFRKATWRVLVHHMPIYASKPNAYSQPCREQWTNLLAKAHIDLALNAHTHQMAFHPANTIGNPYPIFVGGGNKAEQASVMILEADQHHLRLRMLDSTGKEAFPTFEKNR
ncbi:MAG TPA: FN3 domain-containing metallophosphoesterase family protein [Candidatus Sulfotelmatobacter sp.]|nr:FN3 domain-containing metallophosphoesterase family protein [Candidatus Sulfotelmatobacter sp.]